MNHKQLIQAIREEFEEALQKKTGWGKNEVLNEYDQAVSRALLRFL